MNALVRENKATGLSKKTDLDVLVYPNPVVGQNLNVQIKNQIYFNGQLELVAMDGRKVLSKPIISGFDSLNTDGLQ